MKTINKFSWMHMAKAIFCTVVFLTIGCERPAQEEINSIENDSRDSDWVTFLEDMEFESIILAQKQDELSDALLQASVGDVVFFEENATGDNLNIETPNSELFALLKLDNEQIGIKNMISNELITNQSKISKNNTVANN